MTILPSAFRQAAAFIVLLGGCGRGFNEEAVVDCASLVPVPMERVGDLGSEVLLDELGQGEAQVMLLWTTGQRTRAFLSTPAPGHALTNLFGGWAVQAKLDCIPAATTSVHLEAPADAPRPLVVGGYPISRFGFDVPDLEQGDEPGSVVSEGQIVIQAVSENTVTGYFDGAASADLKSNFGQRPLGISVEVVAMAFNEVRLLDDYPSDE